MNKLFLFFIVLCYWYPNTAISQSPYDFNITSEEILIQLKSTTKIPNLTVYRGYVNRNKIATKNPIIGKTKVEGNRLSFKPLVPFSKILKYTIALDNYLHYFELGLEDNYEFINIINVYPNSKYWPANILKFHILFDTPVSITNVYDHIYFLDAEGKKVDRIILDLGQAITDSGQKLLTIWIEPGRQKRDLAPNQILGSPFEVGKSYTLIIDSSIKDKNGIPMKMPFSKNIIITDPVRTRPDPSYWKITTPGRNQIEPLYIDTKTAFDYKSLLAHVFIMHESKEIKGILEYSDLTKIITFSPNLPWLKGDYTLHIDDIIEDLAGNTPQRLFDTDLNNKDEFQSYSKPILEFKIE